MTMTPIIITFEEARDAAAKVREYMNKGERCRGPQWVEETFDLGYILQEWRNEYWDENGNRVIEHPEYDEEYQYIHSAGTYNWHMYEDPEY